MNGNLTDYQKMFDCLDAMLFIITHSGEILAINKAVTKRLGYDRNDLVGKNVLIVHPPGSEEEVAEVLGRLIDADEVLCSLPILTKVGKTILTETRIYKGTWEGQQVLFGFCSDITSQRNTEKKCEAIFRKSPIPILVSKVDDGTIIDVNEAWCNLIWCVRESIIGHTTHELGVWKDLREREKLIRLLKEDGYVKNHPITLKSSDGDSILGLITGVAINVDGEDLWITSFVDHSEQRLLERQLDKLRESTLTSALKQLDKQFSSNKYIRISD